MFVFILLLLWCTVLVQPLIQQPPPAFFARKSNPIGGGGNGGCLVTDRTTTSTSRNPRSANMWLLQVLPWRRKRKRERKRDDDDEEDVESIKNASEAYLFSLTGSSPTTTSAHLSPSKKKEEGTTPKPDVLSDDHKNGTIVSLTDDDIDNTTSPELRQQLQLIRRQYQQMKDRLPLDYPPNPDVDGKDAIMNVTGKIASKVLDDMMLREIYQARQRQERELFLEYNQEKHLVKTKGREKGDDSRTDDLDRETIIGSSSDDDDDDVSTLNYIYDDDTLDEPNEEDEIILENSLNEVKRKKFAESQMEAFKKYEEHLLPMIEEDDGDDVDEETLWEQLASRTSALDDDDEEDEDDETEGEEEVEEEEEDEFSAEIRDLFGELEELRDLNRDDDSTNVTALSSVSTGDDDDDDDDDDSKGDTTTTSASSNINKRNTNFRPSDYKEWQMYKKISDTMDLSVNAKRSDRDKVQNEMQGEILDKLNDWKAFQEKENELRILMAKEEELEIKEAKALATAQEAASVASTMEKEDDEHDVATTTTKDAVVNPRDDPEVRKEVAEMGYNLLESLVNTTTMEEFLPDLQKDLEDLRIKMQDDSYNPFPEEEEEDDKKKKKEIDVNAPVDLSSAFGNSIRNKIKSTAHEKRQQVIRKERFSKSLGRSVVDEQQPPLPPPPPKKQAKPKPMQQATIEDIVQAQEKLRQQKEEGGIEEKEEEVEVAAPDTPFFQQDDEEDVDEEEEDDDDYVPSSSSLDMEEGKLGSYEDQLVENYVRKSGATTQAERARVRAEYEAFLAKQKEIRYIPDEVDAEEELGIDAQSLSEGDDGSIDTTALLESIKRREEETFGDLDLEAELGPLETDFDDIQDDILDRKPSSSSSMATTRPREEDVMPAPPDTPFFEDDGEDIMPDASFLRDTARDEEDDDDDIMPLPPDTPFFRDDPTPTETSIDPSPRQEEPSSSRSSESVSLSDLFAQRKEDSTSEGKKATTTTTTQQQEPPNTPFFRGVRDTTSEEKESKTTEAVPPPRQPSRPRRQNKKLSGMQGGFLGVEAFGTSSEEDEEVEEEEIKQTKQEEEEGAEDPGPVDDEDEYIKSRIAAGEGDVDEIMLGGNFRKNQEDRAGGYWGITDKEAATFSSASFKRFKEELLSYNHLLRDQLDLLMSLKSYGQKDPFEFAPRIKHPFDRFGVILRLEGLLVDVSNLQYFAWKKISEENGFIAPREDAIGHASVVRPDIAVRQIFQWVGSQEPTYYIRSEQIAGDYRRIFRQVFFSYLDKGMSPTATLEDAATSIGSAQAIGDDMLKMANKQREEKEARAKEEAKAYSNDDRPMATMGQARRFAIETWCEIAQSYGYPEPPTYQLREATSFAPEVVVSKIFGWTNSLEVMREMSQLLQRTMDYKLRDFSGIIPEETAEDRERSEEEKAEAKFLSKFGTERKYVTMDPSIKGWIQSLLNENMAVGIVSHMDRDIVDALMDYTGLNDLIPADKRVTATDGYTRSENVPYLGCCLRLEREPDHVAIVDVAPNSLNEAEAIEFPAVGVPGVFPVYDMSSADWVVRDPADMLTPTNIRRLFSDRENKEPQTAPQNMKPIRPRKKVKVDFLDPDEEKEAEKEAEAKKAGKAWWVQEAEERQEREAELQEEYEEGQSSSGAFYEDPSEDDGYMYDEKYQ